MLNAITSLRLPVLFAPVIATLANCSPPLAAPKTTVLVNAVDAPPLSEMKNAEDGMLSPTPSVRAAAALAKYAYTPSSVRPGFNVQAVVAVMLVLPGFAALPALSAKFTALAERFSVRDSVRLALRAMVCAPEFNCADAIDAANVIASTATAIRKNIRGISSGANGTQVTPEDRFGTAAQNGAVSMRFVEDCRYCQVIGTK